MKEKQIEEMAQIIYDHTEHDTMWDEIYASSNALYNAGYRKQSEGVWERTTEPLGAHNVDCVECSVCGDSWVLDEDFDFDVVKDCWNYCPNCGAKMKGGAE